MISAVVPVHFNHFLASMARTRLGEACFVFNEMHDVPKSGASSNPQQVEYIQILRHMRVLAST